MATWSAPVRYAEVDQQGVVFNAHYLLWCDEAIGAYCAQRGLDGFAAMIRLVTSTLTWHAPARWGDVVDVEVRCARIGRTSVAVHFDLAAAARPCCTVDTTYVHTDDAGMPQPISAAQRAALASPRGE